MTDNITVREVPIETTFGMIREMNIPDRDMVEAFAHSALRCVRMALAENNIYSAIDTLDKTRLVEEYIKSKVQRNQAQLQTQNIIAADRYEMLWELGGWLGDHVNHANEKQTGVSETAVPKFWLIDIGINSNQSKKWQAIRRNISNLNDLRSWCQDYIADGKELQWGLLWSYANPRQPKEPEPKIEVELTSPGKKLYKAIKDIRKLFKEYFEYISKNDTSLREYIFMANALMEIGREFILGSNKLSKAEKEND